MRYLLFFVSFVSFAAQVTLGPGTSGYGVATGRLTSTITITANGTPTGGGPQRAYIYFDPSNNQSFTVALPQGMTGACSGGGVTCVFKNATAFVDAPSWCDFTSPGWPKAPDGTNAAGMVACWNINAAGATTMIHPLTAGDLFNANPSYYYGVSEGCDCMYSGRGPGPVMVINNHIEGAANLWHMDNAGYNWSWRGNHTYKRNYFLTPPYARPMDSTWDGAGYTHRQNTEWKGGERLYIEGNIWEGSYNHVGPSALTVAFANRDGFGVRDVWVNYNEFRHVVGGTLGAHTYAREFYGGAAGNESSIGLPRNYWYTNNLIWDIQGNGKSYSLPGATGGGYGPGEDGNGWFIQGGDGSEDLVIDHNTIVGNQGRMPVLIHWQNGEHAEGTTVTNNVFSVDRDWKGINHEGMSLAGGAESCAATLLGEASWLCMVTNGTFKNNLMIPLVSSITCPNGANCTYNTSQADVQAAFATLGGSNFITATTTLSNIGWQNHKAHMGVGGPREDYHFKSTSAYISGGASRATDGKDVGVDIDELRARQGKVEFIGVAPATVTADVRFTAPDAQGCPVDISTASDIVSNFVRVTDPGGARARSISVSGLTTRTTYYGMVECAVEQPKFVFRTK